MKTTRIAPLCLMLPAAFWLANAHAETAGLTEALAGGDVTLNFRLRYEQVKWDGLEDSDALTLRTRLTYQSGNFAGFGLTLEFDDVRDLDKVDYRTAGNDSNNPGTAIIPDPEHTEVNRALLSYQNFDTVFKLGRQRIILDNQRFVGGVGWRQNEQTYDAFSITNTSLADTRFYYAYVQNVNRIFGKANPIGDHRHDSHLLNVNYAGLPWGALSGYAYLLDNESAPVLSSNTFGLRWVGKVAENYGYTLEYATQSDAGDSPLDYSADYFLAEGSAKFGPVSLTLGYEVLGSDDGEVGFMTPLATLHAFQGWTDRFLDTPAAGVEDLYLKLSSQVAGFNLLLAYHDLSANEGSASYGSEIGFQVTRRVGPVNLLLKYADYSADDFGSDTKKLWLMAEATF